MIAALSFISAGYCFWLMTVPLSYDWVPVVLIGFLVSLLVFPIAAITTLVLYIRLRRSRRAPPPTLAIVLAITVIAVRPLVASQDADVMAPVQQFIDGFNKSDIKMVEAACADQTFIIDDFPPHEWHGSGAAAKWYHELSGFGKKYGMSDAFVTLRKPRQITVTGTHAYAVVPVNLRFNDKGQLVKRTGLMTLALHKEVAGWRIAAWTWTWGVGGG